MSHADLRALFEDKLQDFVEAGIEMQGQHKLFKDGKNRGANTSTDNGGVFGTPKEVEGQEFSLQELYDGSKQKDETEDKIKTKTEDPEGEGTGEYIASKKVDKTNQETHIYFLVFASKSNYSQICQGYLSLATL